MHPARGDSIIKKMQPAYGYYCDYSHRKSSPIMDPVTIAGPLPGSQDSYYELQRYTITGTKDTTVTKYWYISAASIDINISGSDFWDNYTYLSMFSLQYSYYDWLWGRWSKFQNVYGWTSNTQSDLNNTEFAYNCTFTSQEGGSNIRRFKQSYYSFIKLKLELTFKNNRPVNVSISIFDARMNPKESDTSKNYGIDVDPWPPSGHEIASAGNLTGSCIQGMFDKDAIDEEQDNNMIELFNPANDTGKEIEAKYAHKMIPKYWDLNTNGPNTANQLYTGATRT